MIVTTSATLLLLAANASLMQRDLPQVKFRAFAPALGPLHCTESFDRSDAWTLSNPGVETRLCLYCIADRHCFCGPARGLLSGSNMFGMFGGFGLGGGTFDSNYRAYPVSFIDKGDAEHADKVFLPPSALDRLGKFC